MLQKDILQYANKKVKGEENNCSGEEGQDMKERKTEVQQSRKVLLNGHHQEVLHKGWKHEKGTILDIWAEIFQLFLAC